MISNVRVPVLVVFLWGLCGAVARGAESRIAVWGFSAEAEDAEGDFLGGSLAELTEAELTRRGCEVVDRRNLARILDEHELGFTRFAGARAAARAGRIVRADVVLVGTVLKSRKGRLVTMKAVETSSGKVLDACARALSETNLRECAAAAAGFAIAAPGRKLGERTFLAVGAFEDLNLNDRFVGLGEEIRTELVRSLNQDPDVTLVEREHVEPLLLELGLSKSGLAAPGFGRTDAAPAFLIVDGFYRSYSERGIRVAANLRLEPVGRPPDVAQVDARPGEDLHERTRRAVLAYLARGRGRTPPARAAAKEAEAKAHLERGLQQSRISIKRKPYPVLHGIVGGTSGLTRDPKRLRNIENAVSSFESAILLAPPNYEAKFVLAVCLADLEIREFRRARRLWEEVIAGSPDIVLRQLATVLLARSFITEQKKVPTRKPSPSPEMHAAYRQAIGIWLKLADEVKSYVFKARVLEEADFALRRLCERGLAPREESLALSRRCIEAQCRALVEQARSDRRASVAARALQTCWSRLFSPRSEDSFKRCMSLAAELAARYPSLEHVIYFGLIGMVPRAKKLAVAERTIKPVLERPEELLGLSGAYHTMMPWIASMHAEAGRWKEAAKICEVVAAYHAQRYPRARPRPENEVMRARCYRELGLWREAFAIYEALGDIEVDTGDFRALGSKVSVKSEMAICREHWREEKRPHVERGTLGAPVAHVPDERGEGRSNSPVVIAALAMIGRDLWIGCRPERATYGGSRRKGAEGLWGRKGGLYRYDTRAGDLDAVALDESAASKWITSLEPEGDELWAGTFGGGLYRLNTRTRKTRRWTEADGLVSDCVSALCLARRSELWVGFSLVYSGACGKLDTRSGEFVDMVPRLTPEEIRSPSGWGPIERDAPEKGPVRAVSAIRASAGRWVWVAVFQKGLQRYDISTRSWDTATHNRDFRTDPRRYGGPVSSSSHHLSCLAVGDGFVAVGAGQRNQPYGGTVDTYRYEQATWGHVSLKDGLPLGNVYSLAAGGRTLWIGGEGLRGDCYVASYDLGTKKLARMYAVPNRRPPLALLVDGGRLWIGAGTELYRVDIPPEERGAPVAALVEAADSPREEVRKEAVSSLREVGDAAAALAIAKKLKDGDSKTRIRAAKALGELGDRAASPALVRALKDTDPQVLRSAIEALGEIGDRDSVPAVCEMLDDRHRDIPWVAAMALGKMGDPDAVPHLVAALKHASTSVRRSAASSLGKIGDRSATPALLGALRDELATVRQAVARALGELGDRSAVPNLIKALEDPDAGVRSSAAEALGKIGDPSAVPPLIDGLRWESPLPPSPMARAYVEALGRLGDRAAVPAVIGTLGNRSMHARCSAADVLGELGDPAAVPALIGALNDAESHVRWRAARALGKLGDRSAIPALIEAVGRMEPRARVRSARSHLEALSRLSDGAFVQVILDALRSEPPQAPGGTAPPRDDRAVVPVLIDALKDRTTVVRMYAAETLGRLDDRRAVAALIRASVDGEVQVRYRAVAALGELRDPSALPALVEALRDESRGVRRNAAEALVKIGDPSALGALREALEREKNPRMRQDMQEAIEALGESRR